MNHGQDAVDLRGGALRERRATLDDLREAVTTLEDTERTARRVRWRAPAQAIGVRGARSRAPRPRNASRARKEEQMHPGCAHAPSRCCRADGVTVGARGSAAPPPAPATRTRQILVARQVLGRRGHGDAARVEVVAEVPAATVTTAPALGAAFQDRILQEQGLARGEWPSRDHCVAAARRSYHCCVGAAGYGRRRERFASQLSQALEGELEEQFYAALRRPDERAAFSPLQAQI